MRIQPSRYMPRTEQATTISTGRRRALMLTILGLALLAGLIGWQQQTEAALPGANGLIAFESNRDGNLEVYVTNPDGTGVTNLTNNAAADSFPAWSPDGSEIAFRSDRDGDSEIFVMNADGTGVT